MGLNCAHSSMYILTSDLMMEGRSKMKIMKMAGTRATARIPSDMLNLE